MVLPEGPDRIRNGGGPRPRAMGSDPGGVTRPGAMTAATTWSPGGRSPAASWVEGLSCEPTARGHDRRVRPRGGSPSRRAVVVLVAALLAGRTSAADQERQQASPAVTVPPGTTAQVDLDGRPFRLHVPPGYDPATPVPLLVGLHGYTSNSSELDSYVGLSAAADERGLLLALPDGTTDPAGDRFWNAVDGGCLDSSLPGSGSRCRVGCAIGRRRAGVPGAPSGMGGADRGDGGAGRAGGHRAGTVRRRRPRWHRCAGRGCLAPGHRACPGRDQGSPAGCRTPKR